MRRVLALAAVTTAVLAAAGCTGVTIAPEPTAAPTTTAPATATVTVAPPPSPGDPAVTKQVCADAAAGAADVTRVFTEQLAVLEAAAAKGDQAAMVAAAELIQKKFLDLAASLATLSQKFVDSDVKDALTAAAATLKEISSESYPGTTQDTQKRLGDVAATFAKACA